MLGWMQRQGRFDGSWAEVAAALHTTELGAVNACLQVVEQKFVRVSLAGGQMQLTITERGSRHRQRP